MTTAEIALTISALSLTISALSLYWNYRSKFIAPKPRLEVRVTNINRGGLIGANCASALRMTVVNHGPGRAVISGIIQTLVLEVKNGLGGSSTQHLNLFSGNNDPFDGLSNADLPVTMEVGDAITLYYADQTLMTDLEKLDSIFVGVVDTWNRTHQPKRKELDPALASMAAIWKKRQEARDTGIVAN